MKAERSQMLESIETKGKNPWDYVETVEEQDTSMNYGPYQDFIATGKIQNLTSLLQFLDLVFTLGHDFYSVFCSPLFIIQLLLLTTVKQF
jgi:hypothetical protein